MRPIRNWLARRRAARRDWEFRVGYLAALDLQLFPDAEPMLQQPPTPAMKAGLECGRRLQLVIPMIHEAVRRTVRSEV